jgi:lysine decarboxylase
VTPTAGVPDEAPVPPEDAPLLAAWFAARAEARRPMQIPGHKNRYAHGDDAFAADLIGPLVRDDMALQGGVDDNAFTHRYLEQAEALWSRAVGADHARFLVGGSSQGNIAALCAIARPDRDVVVDRTSHRSAHAGLVISGGRPVWIHPDLHPEFGVPVGVPPSALTAVPGDATGVFVTSPSYVGTLSDVRGLAAVAHAHGLPLVVDQAWAAGLGFLPGRGAIEQGADLCVTSVHKALLGYSQTAVVTLRSGLVEVAQLDRSVDLTSTTSESGTLLASIDATRAALARDGGRALERTMAAAATMRHTLAGVRGLVVLDDTLIPGGMDPFKVTLWLPRTGVDGVALGARLTELGHSPESADHDTVVMTVTLADDDAFLADMAGIVIALIDSLRGEPRPPAAAAVWSVDPEVVVTPREAFFARRRRIPLAQSVGEVSAEQFTPYPPGVPLLAPGERITAEVVAAVAAAGRVGRVAYSSDRTLATVEVVDDLA